MDPNEYDSLLADLVASFSNVNSEIMVISLVVLAAVVFILRKELALLDVITLGKDQAADFRIRVFWNDHSGRRPADCRTGIYVYGACERIYYIFWRHLFPVSAADGKEEGVSLCVSEN